jgi:hypothetical protein
MDRYLVVAHQTVLSSELLQEAQARAASPVPTVFHLVVPVLHGPGLVWSEGECRAAARAQLDRALDRWAATGLAVAGEVGDANPVYAVSEVLERHDRGHFRAVIVSTLPPKLSRWLRMDVAHRIEKASGLAVHHVVGGLVPV